MMPIAGTLVAKVQPKWLIAVGFSFIAASMWVSRGLNLEITMGWAIWTRIVFAFGGPLIFIPINVAAYAFVPKGKNNAASGLINLARNMGASIGIAGLSTMIERRAQFHQNVLVSHLTPYDLATRSVLVSGSGDRSLALLYGGVQRQAALLSYIDGFHVMMVAILVAIPMVLLFRDVDRSKAVEVPVH
jgi:DHA2 family multidrug resistance protein